MRRPPVFGAASRRHVPLGVKEIVEPLEPRDHGIHPSDGPVAMVCLPVGRRDGVAPGGIVLR
ncbi:hypothetical protein [Sorangium sp. So ce854]|uniref:hypothetical protein n=1 Tax=Sorangium sp. So ce854 TaxID=3133322 RepID=UPI003F61107E